MFLFKRASLFLLGAAVAFCLISPVFSQDDGKKDGTEKKEEETVQKVTVKGEVFSEKDSPYTVNIIDKKKIEEMNLKRSADILKEVPGVKVTDYGQAGVSNAVIIRGFSSGVHGSDMGVYLDGVPLNEFVGHGGGYAEPNVIIPLELDRVLVYKGPSSALFGNFSKGGNIAYFTKKKDIYDIFSLSFGSFNTYDAQAAIGTRMSDNLWNNTAIQGYGSKGFSENSDQYYGNVSTRFTYTPYDKLEITLSLRAHNDNWNAAGYISKEQFESSDRFKQDPQNGNDGGWRHQFNERLDITYSATKELKMIAWGFAMELDWVRYQSGRSASGSVPAFQQLEYNYETLKAGSGLNINYKDNLLSAIAGLEYYRDDTIAKRYWTTDRVRNTTGTIIDTNQDIHFNNYVAFAEGEIKIVKYLRPTIGVRYDVFDGDMLNNLDHSKRYFKADKYNHISPKFGIRSTIIDEVLDLRASACNGFILPSPSILFNTADLTFDPSNIWQYEAGFNVKYKNIASFDAAVFRIDVTNDVQLVSGTTYINNGETRREGFELSGKLSPVDIIELSGSYTYVRTKLIKNAKASLEGRHIAGVPEQEADAMIKFKLPLGLELFGKMNYIGKWYLIDDGANVDTYDGYILFNAGISYRQKGEKDINLSFEVKNIANTAYAPSASKTTGGITSFAVGAPRSYNLSAMMKW